MFEKHLQSDPGTSTTTRLTRFWPLDNTTWGTSLIALMLISFLSDWNLRGCVLSILPVTGLLLVFVVLMPGTGNDSLRISPIDIEEMIVPLSSRTVLVLLVMYGAQTTLFGFQNDILLPSLLSGITKTLSWYCTIHAVCSSSILNVRGNKLTLTAHGLES